MIRKLRIIIFAFLIVITVAETSRAMIVQAIAIGAGALIGSAIYFSGLYFYMKPTTNNSHRVDGNGDVYRDIGVVYVDLDLPEPVDKPLTAKITKEQAKTLANAKPSTYPRVKEALNENDSIESFPDDPVKGSQLKVGDKRMKDGQVYQVTNVSTYGFQSTPPQTSYYNWPNITSYFTGAVYYPPPYDDQISGSSSKTSVTWAVSVPDPPRLATPVEYKANLTGNEQDENAEIDNIENPLIQAELDKMLQDPDYVPNFSDATTGLPYSPPNQSDVATPEQIKAHNDSHTADESKSAAIASAENAAASAESAAQAAQSAATAAQNAANANPGDAGLQQAAIDAAAAAARARAEADRARAEADRTKAEQDSGTAEESAAEAITPPGAPGANVYEPLTDKPDKKEILSLLQNWVASSPLGSMVRSFVINTSGGVSSVSCGTFYGKEIKFNFAEYQNTFNICGGMLLVIVHGFAIIVVMKGW